MIARVVLIVAAALLLAPGCASTSATADLARAEVDKLQDVQQRLRKNRRDIASSLGRLEAVAGRALEIRHQLSTSVAKARLLESMRSPWSNPHPDMAATQKEVALYHLFALSEAEAATLAAKRAERRAVGADVLRKYDRLASLTGKAIASEKLVIAYLDKPPTAQVSESVRVLLEETKAFREELAGSDNPRLQQLAREVASAEKKAERTQEKIEKALERIQALKKEIP